MQSYCTEMERGAHAPVSSFGRRVLDPGGDAPGLGRVVGRAVADLPGLRSRVAPHPAHAHRGLRHLRRRPAREPARRGSPVRPRRPQARAGRRRPGRRTVARPVRDGGRGRRAHRRPDRAGCLGRAAHRSPRRGPHRQLPRTPPHHGRRAERRHPADRPGHRRDVERRARAVGSGAGAARLPAVRRAPRAAGARTVRRPRAGAASPRRTPLPAPDDQRAAVLTPAVPRRRRVTRRQLGTRRHVPVARALGARRGVRHHEPLRRRCAHRRGHRRRRADRPGDPADGHPSRGPARTRGPRARPDRHRVVRVRALPAGHGRRQRDRRCGLRRRVPGAAADAPRHRCPDPPRRAALHDLRRQLPGVRGALGHRRPARALGRARPGHRRVRRVHRSRRGRRPRAAAVAWRDALARCGASGPVVPSSCRERAHARRRSAQHRCAQRRRRPCPGPQHHADASARAAWPSPRSGAAAP